jgi:V8-like Glu-specific endopeptidase
MEFTIDKIAAIANNSNFDNRKKIDELLHMDCLMYAYLGTDSTDDEREAVKNMSQVIYQAIFEIDNEEGSMLINTD